MRIHVLKLYIFLSVFISIVSITYATPLSQNGQLQVIGNQLSNECGQPVQLRGVSSHGLQWYGLASCMDYCCATESAITYLANNVGIDIFRIAVYPDDDPIFGYASNPSGFTAQVNNLVQICEQNGIYALIDWHVLEESNPLVNLTYAQQFWSDMATAHKDRKNVIYEICNEPNYTSGDGSWTNIRTYANTIIPIIRAIDPDAVIVVGTPNWSQLGSEVVNNQLSYSNIMYTFHFYAATHDTSMLSNYINQLPIFVTEWGATEASGAGGTNYTRADEFINIMAGNTGGPKISWCSWSWSEAPETSGMLNVGACNAENWSSLKPTGSYVMGKISNPADSFGSCSVATPTPTSNGLTPIPTETIPATDLRLDSMTDGDDTSNICTYWYSYDDSNDCTDKDCAANPHGDSQIVPWSKDHWEDLGQPVQKFYMQQPGRNGAGDYAARITGVVTTTFLYGFTGLGLPLVEPEGPVDIHTATGISFWCKSNESRDFRLKINSPQAFGGALDEDMYGYIFTAGTSWQKVTVDFSSLLFSQEGWGDTSVTKTMALSAVDTIQWQTEGQTGAPYNYDLWIDDVVLINAPQALKDKAAAGCVPPTDTPTWDPSVPTYTPTPTPAYEMRVNAAGPQYTDGSGHIWYADQTYAGHTWGYEGGGGEADNTGTPIGGTTDDTLYQTERWGSPTYRFDLPNGTYEVTLKFVETYFTGTGSRIFDVNVEGTLAVDNLDLVATAGNGNAYDVVVVVTVSDGTLDIVTSATVDGALINAIQVVGYSVPVDTPTNTQTYTYTQMNTATSTSTYTYTPTRTATSTDTETAVDTNTQTYTMTYTQTPADTITQTPTDTVTDTPVDTATNTPADTFTYTPTNTATDTFTETHTATNTYTPTETPTGPPPSTWTYTETFTQTDTPTNTSTNTPVNTLADTATETATNTPTETATAVPSNTSTEIPTETETPPPGSTDTYTPTETQTAMDTQTETFTQTETETPVPTESETPTITDTVPPGSTDTYTPTETNTAQNTQTYTYTFTATYTQTFTQTYTMTATSTPTLSINITLASPSTINAGIDTDLYVYFDNNRAVTSIDAQLQDFFGAPVQTVTLPASAFAAGSNNMIIALDDGANGFNLATVPTGSYRLVLIATNGVDMAISPLTILTINGAPTVTYTPTTIVVVSTDTYTPTATNTAQDTATYTYTYTPTETATAIIPTPTPTQGDTLEITELLPYPNPFNPTVPGARARFAFNVSQTDLERISLRIYTAGYRLVKEVVFEQSAMTQVINRKYIEYNAEDLANMANGTYYYIIIGEKGGEIVRSKVDKLIILK